VFLKFFYIVGFATGNVFCNPYRVLDTFERLCLHSSLLSLTIRVEKNIFVHHMLMCSLYIFGQPEPEFRPPMSEVVQALVRLVKKIRNKE